jgi:hypothetical protein
MDYHKNILKKMKFADWPDFERGNFLNVLDQLAKEMHEKDTTEGYLASLLIYQQLSEEILRLLDKYSNLLIQCSVFPQEINFKDLDGKTFGYLIGAVENGLLDDELRKLLKICKDFNALRNRIVHKITLKNDVTDIRRQARQARKYYDKIFTSYEIIIDNYRLTLKDYHKNYEEYEELVGRSIKKKVKRKTRK